MTSLALGTVQFGLDYGITNQAGQVPLAECGRILARAGALGIDLLDTAAAYGASERVLSRLLVPPQAAFRLVTKTLPLHGRNATDGLAAFDQALEQSLSRLAADRPLYGVLVHQAADLLSAAGEALFARLARLQEHGRIEKIGASVYGAAELQALLARYPLDLVQLPHNVLDQRLRQSGWLAQLAELGVEIHARSAFLQGLLLLPPDRLPPHLAGLAPPIRRMIQRADELEASPMALALAYLRQRPEIGQVVVGVQSAAQLDEVAHAWTMAAALPAGCADDLGFDAPQLLNPACWSQLEAKA